MAYLDESPRVLMIKGKFEEGYKILMKMARVSGRTEVLEKLQKPSIKKEVYDDIMKVVEKLKDQEFAKFSQIFQPRYLRITLIIWSGWFADTFVYYGIMF